MEQIFISSVWKYYNIRDFWKIVKMARTEEGGDFIFGILFSFIKIYNLQSIDIYVTYDYF